MPDELPVRQWQERFRAGAFNAQDRYTQCKAGWYDWFCQDHALAGRLKKIGRWSWASQIPSSWIITSSGSKITAL